MPPPPPAAGPEHAPNTPAWSALWEDDLSDVEHVALAGLLATCFPRSAGVLTGARSWISGRPELRVVAAEADRPVAHLAVLRRFLRHGDGSVPVGDVGLVGVRPERRGTGLGAELLARTHVALRGLGLPFGFLTCGERVAEFYATAGWRRVGNPVRMIRADGRVQVYGGVAMVLPVAADPAGWPDGPLDRNGYEV